MWASQGFGLYLPNWLFTLVMHTYDVFMVANIRFGRAHNLFTPNNIELPLVLGAN